MTKPPPDPLNIRLLENQLRNLTINIIVNEQPSSGPAPASTGALPTTSSSRSPLTPPTTSTWRVSPAACPPEVLRLGGGLTSLRLGSGEERVRTAYQLGREAAAIPSRRGFLLHFDGDLGAAHLLRGLVRDRLERGRSTSANYVKTGPGGSWDFEAVSHGVVSQAEAEAFCRVAGLGGLPRNDRYDSFRASRGLSHRRGSRCGKCGQALIVKAVPSGFILCVPQRCVSEEELDQATLDDHSGGHRALDQCQRAGRERDRPRAEEDFALPACGPARPGGCFAFGRGSRRLWPGVSFLRQPAGSLPPGRA